MKSIKLALKIKSLTVIISVIEFIESSTATIKRGFVGLPSPTDTTMLLKSFTCIVGIMLSPVPMIFSASASPCQAT